MQKQRQVQFIIVNHATAEKPGMQEMAKYLKRIFPDALVEYVDIRFPLTGISPLFHTGK
jgi:hypothetical protein